MEIKYQYSFLVITLEPLNREPKGQDKPLIRITEFHNPDYRFFLERA